MHIIHTAYVCAMAYFKPQLHAFIMMEMAKFYLITVTTLQLFHQVLITTGTSNFRDISHFWLNWLHVLLLLLLLNKFDNFFPIIKIGMQFSILRKKQAREPHMCGVSMLGSMIRKWVNQKKKLHTIRSEANGNAIRLHNAISLCCNQHIRFRSVGSDGCEMHLHGVNCLSLGLWVCLCVCASYFFSNEFGNIKGDSPIYVFIFESQSANQPNGHSYFVIHTL